MKNSAVLEELKLELIRDYETYLPAIRALTGVPLEVAREALHRAICQVLVGVSKRGPISPVVALRPYVLQAAMNALRKERNERKRVTLFSELAEEDRQKLFAIPDPRPTPEAMIEAKETSAVLWAEVASLAPREAAVLTRWAHNDSFGEIADALGIAASTVRVLWMRGIQHLRNRPRVQQLAA